jgi:hypothetical protein
LDLHAENHIVEHLAPGQQQVLLQHVANAADCSRGVNAINERTPASRLQQAGDDIEDRTFPAARRADETDESTLCNRERHRRERLEIAGVLNIIPTWSRQSFAANAMQLLTLGSSKYRKLPQEACPPIE